MAEIDFSNDSIPMHLSFYQMIVDQFLLLTLVCHMVNELIELVCFCMLCCCISSHIISETSSVDNFGLVAIMYPVHLEM
jgi:hypothetical protein